MRMVVKICRVAFCPVLVLIAANAEAAKPAERMPVVESGKAAGRVVVVGEAAPELAYAAEVLTSTVVRWSGVRLEAERLGPGDAGKRNPNAIVLARFRDYQRLNSDRESTSSVLRRVEFGGDEGFGVGPGSLNGEPCLYVLGNSAKGVLNGAFYVRDFLIDGSRENLRVARQEAMRAPQMAARGTYALGIYGVMPQYTEKDWMPILRSFARDGMNRVYFWVSGMFPSKKFPQTFDRDASAKTRIREVSQIREISRQAHNLGLKFYLGSGVFAWSTAYYLGDGVTSASATGAGGLDPSNAEVRRRHKEYFNEMIDALPEADGFFLEMRDEHGECKCPVCQCQLDAYGSKMYGEALISFVQELAEEVWRRHPHARFCMNVGYAEHEKDVNYYHQISQMRDERFEWLDCREAWQFPGPKGEKLPASYFTRQVIHWDQFYSRPLSDMIAATSRIAHEGYFGYCPAFEPGFNTADYYSHEIPYPTDDLAYAATGFAYRELTWEPADAAQNLAERFQRRFFGEDGSAGMGEEVMKLRDLVVTKSAPLLRYSQDWISYSGATVPHPTLAGEITRLESAPTTDSARAAGVQKALADVKMLLEIRDHELPLLAALEKRIAAARAGAGPKTAQTLGQMQRLLDDTRRHFSTALPDPKVLEGYSHRLDAVMMAGAK